MRFIATAIIAGASSALDLYSPPAPERPAPGAAVAGYWANTGAYLWHGVDAQQALYEAQRPLFDADALTPHS